MCLKEIELEQRMAASSSSNESCVAPTDFHVSSSLDESNGKYSVTFERCPLCAKSKRVYYCTSCLRNGDFIHSKTRYPERFADKKVRLFKSKLHLKSLDSCTDVLKRNQLIEETKFRVKLTKERIGLLQLRIEENRASTEKNMREVERYKEEFATSKAPKLQEKNEKMQRHRAQNSKNLDRQKCKLASCQTELKSLIRENISQLVTYIFQISEVHMSSDDNDSLGSVDTVSALAEATRTAYIRGRWVITDNCGDIRYKIVEPMLPGSGNYSAYTEWVTSNRDSVPGAVGNEAGLQKNEAYTISAALTYTAQMTAVLAFYLDLGLPKRLCYSEFCSMDLTEKQFAKKVAKLDTNILHLCFSQHVDPELLHPRRTIYNIRRLLDVNITDLGRCGAFEVNPDLMQSMEDSLMKDLDVSESSEDDGLLDELDLGNEWEALPLPNLPEFPVYPQRVTSSTLPVHGGPSRDTRGPDTETSVTGGLVSSAAASVASWWRAAIGHK